MRTKLRETFDKESYKTLNARITDVVYGPQQFVISVASRDHEYEVKPITNGVGDPLMDLMRVLGVEKISDIEGQLVRTLHFDIDLSKRVSWSASSNTRVLGIANIIEDRCIILSDYERQARLVPDPAANDDEPKPGGIFTMASINPPPGGAWVILKIKATVKPYRYDLYSEAEETVLAHDLDERLVKWLVEEARIAHYQETEA